MIQVGIIGGAGYTAGELLRLLINHPKVQLNFIFSTSNAGNPVYKVHQDLLGLTDLKFSHEINPDVDVVFLCLGHGNSKTFLETHAFSKTTKIIDLSNDFRLNENRNFQDKTFVYGLPELNKEQIKTAQFIANPGCFATGYSIGFIATGKREFISR